jgi:hypothetical protein
VKLTVKQHGYPGVEEYCSWACLLAVAASEAESEAANKALWQEKVAPHADCNATTLDSQGQRWFCKLYAGHSGSHDSIDGKDPWLTRMTWV